MQSPAPVDHVDPEIHFGFAPDAARVRLLDKRMRSSLAASLQHIHQAASCILPESGEALESFLKRLAVGPIRSEAFSYYFDLVVAIENGETDEASGFWQALLAVPASRTQLEIVDVLDPETDPAASRIVRFFLTDSGVECPVGPAETGESNLCRDQISQALDLMHRSDPELADEVCELVRQIYLASGRPAKSGMTFDGASSFMFWGAILINSRRSGGPLEMVQMLAHESAHNLLFGMTAEEPLTLNANDDRHPSPLRLDPRPMEGIYHATYVSARMYRSVKTLLDSGILDAEQTAQAHKALDDDATCFRKGFATVKAHGLLTPTGKGLMDAAALAMADLL